MSLVSGIGCVCVCGSIMITNPQHTSMILPDIVNFLSHSGNARLMQMQFLPNQFSVDEDKHLVRYTTFELAIKPWHLNLIGNILVIQPFLTVSIDKYFYPADD